MTKEMKYEKKLKTNKKKKLRLFQWSIIVYAIMKAPY